MAEDAWTDEELLSAAELGQLTGISPTTFKNWTNRDPALPAVTLQTGHVRFRRRDVLRFCEANPHLGAAAKVRQALRPSAKPAPSHTANDSDLAAENEALKALARDLRNAAHQNLQAALTAARQAEETARTAARQAVETARSHREQLEQLAASMAAYDAALSQITAPSTMND